MIHRISYTPFPIWLRMARTQTPSIESLLADLFHPQKRVCLRTIKRLARRKDTRAVEPLIARLEAELLKTERWDEDLTFELVDALGQLGDPRAIPVLATTLRRKLVNDTAVYAVCEIGTPAVVPSLLYVLSDEDRYGPLTYRTATELLGKLGDRQAVELVFAAAQRYRYLNDDVTVECAVALVRLDDMRGLAILRETLQKKPPAAGHMLAARRLRELCCERGGSFAVDLLQTLDGSMYPFILSDLREHGTSETLPLAAWIEAHVPQYAIAAGDVMTWIAAQADYR
jgi:HEAT repeat protein